MRRNELRELAIFFLALSGPALETECAISKKKNNN